MRMSDWSSDVCSSDLEIEEAQRVDRIERREDDRRMVDDMQHSEHREHQEIAEHDRPEQRPDPRRSVRLQREEPDQDRERDRHDIGLEPRMDIAQRSEEHTSELQSLMRISYAVFCFKKKKFQSNLSLNYTLTISTTLSIRQ